ncbi:hypothetical protein HKX48_006293 [Thoreauomyces humboldtii]|nr:hypothetical protein HKX48_006293 [Thoreauomyces humboldtii]
MNVTHRSGLHAHAPLLDAPHDGTTADALLLDEIADDVALVRMVEVDGDEVLGTVDDLEDVVDATDVVVGLLDAPGREVEEDDEEVVMVALDVVVIEEEEECGRLVDTTMDDDADEDALVVANVVDVVDKDTTIRVVLTVALADDAVETACDDDDDATVPPAHGSGYHTPFTHHARSGVQAQKVVPATQGVTEEDAVALLLDVVEVGDTLVVGVDIVEDVLNACGVDVVDTLVTMETDVDGEGDVLLVTMLELAKEVRLPEL